MIRPSRSSCFTRADRLTPISHAARFSSRHISPLSLVTISKWPDATVAGTTGAHMRAVTHRGSSLPSCRTGPGPHGTWRAMPASVPQPTGAPDTACRQRRPASPRRCVGCAPYSRVRRQPHGLKDCHTLCPDTGVHRALPGRLIREGYPGFRRPSAAEPRTPAHLRGGA